MNKKQPLSEAADSVFALVIPVFSGEQRKGSGGGRDLFNRQVDSKKVKKEKGNEKKEN